MRSARVGGKVWLPIEKDFLCPADSDLKQFVFISLVAELTFVWSSQRAEELLHWLIGPSYVFSCWHVVTRTKCFVPGVGYGRRTEDLGCSAFQTVRCPDSRWQVPLRLSAAARYRRGRKENQRKKEGHVSGTEHVDVWRHPPAAWAVLFG